MPDVDSMGSFHAHCGQCGRLLHPPWKVWKASTLAVDSVGGFHTHQGQRVRL
jgi:hypothetical protein